MPRPARTECKGDADHDAGSDAGVWSALPKCPEQIRGHKLRDAVVSEQQQIDQLVR